jgi:hypothetical protein
MLLNPTTSRQPACPFCHHYKGAHKNGEATKKHECIWPEGEEPKNTWYKCPGLKYCATCHMCEISASSLFLF